MATKIILTFPDGSTKEFDAGITGVDVAKTIGARLASATLAVKFNGVLMDAFLPLNANGAIQMITFDSPEGREVFEHSMAHLFAYAVQELYPDAKNTIGPPVEEGFYYDFDELTLTLEDFAKIEAKMKELASKDEPVSRTELSLADVKRIFKNNPYKIEMAEEFTAKGEKLSAYKIGAKFIDICRGPHVPHMTQLKAFKLMKIAGAYWRGDAKNKQLTRIYGIGFPDDKQLKQHLATLEEASKRDHKKIGIEMGIYMQHDLIGKGLPVWLPKGATMRRVIEQFAIEMEEEAGYIRVSTPHLAKEELFIKSGHLPHYADTMFPTMVMDDGRYVLKAMNCPMHHLVYGNKVWSYKELPVRVAEYGQCFRNELSGTLAGLLRVRSMSMNDAHIYCRKDQIADEINAVLDLIKRYYKVFGFTNYHFRLSRWDPKNKEKYIDEPENWDYAEQVLRDILKNCGVPYVEATNEAAFYGPKIDVQFKTITGREETMSTVQLDFAARKRFGLFYIDKDNKENHDVFVIHRAPLSTHERLIAMLIEHFAGKFPLWLSPEQVRIVTISEKSESWGVEALEMLKTAGIRATLDKRNETLNKKIRDGELDKVNYLCVVGEKEAADKAFNVRSRDDKSQKTMAIAEFVRVTKEQIQKKA